MRGLGPRSAKPGAAVAALSAAAALVAAAPRAWALCPNCLGQNHALTPTMRLVGVFLLVPPAVFFLVARLVRTINRGDSPAP